MADWSDYYSGQQVDSLARCVALRHHDVRVGGSIPGLGSFNTVTMIWPDLAKLTKYCTKISQILLSRPIFPFHVFTHSNLRVPEARHSFKLKGKHSY